MGYAILHSEKGKGKTGGLGHHIDRTPGHEYSYRHADPNKREFNQSFKPNKYTKMEFYKAIDERIKDGYKGTRKIRSDAVRHTRHILTGSHEDMKRIFSDQKTAEAWLKANYDFIVSEFGEENITRFVLHRDEKTPHIHAVTVPLTKDGRLSAKQVIGNRTAMSKRQDRYHKAMEQFSLERGKRATGIKHETARQYYARMEDAQRYVDEMKESHKIKSIDLKVDEVARLEEKPPLFNRSEWLQEQNKKLEERQKKIKARMEAKAKKEAENVLNDLIKSNLGKDEYLRKYVKEVKKIKSEIDKWEEMAKLNKKHSDHNLKFAKKFQKAILSNDPQLIEKTRQEELRRIQREEAQQEKQQEKYRGPSR